MLTPEERARQNEHIGGPCVPDGFVLDVDWWLLRCLLGDWQLSGVGQAQLEAALAAAREHYASAHLAEPNTEDTGKEETTLTAALDRAEQTEKVVEAARVLHATPKIIEPGKQLRLISLCYFDGELDALIDALALASGGETG